MSPAELDSPVLAFGELLDALRRQGFVIGLDQHIRLQVLLDRLADHCPPERLKTYLCPIFATSREEQQRFHRVFDQLYPAFGQVDDLGTSSAAPPSPPPPSAEQSARWRVAVIAGAGLALFLAVGLWRMQPLTMSVPVGPTAPDSPAVVVTPPRPDSLAPHPDSATPIPPPIAGVESVQVRPEPPLPPAPDEPSAPWLVRHRGLVRWLIVLLPIVLFLLIEWRLYRRRRLVLQRQRRTKPPLTWSIKADAPLDPFASSATLPTAARFLRGRERGEVARLAVEESIAATIQALGFPTLRYRTDTRPPEYLALIERQAFRDHGSRLFQSLTRALTREGVHVTRYVYDMDPRVCYTEDGRQEMLVDLRRRFPSHRLLLFGSGDRMVDPISGRLHPWATQLLSWTDRAVLTPETPAAWGQRELALAGHFLVLPATTEGLLAVVDHFRQAVRGSLRSWRDSAPDPALPPLGEDPIPVLRTYLGPDAFRWLAACAVYPELHWDLTLLLGALPAIGRDLIREEHLNRLVRLPWFRQGSLPDDLRARLLEQLSAKEEDAVRLAIVELLERHPAPSESVAANRYDLDLAVQRLGLSGKGAGRRAALDQLQGFSRRELVQDIAVLQLLERTPASRLAMVLPRRLRRVFYRDGIAPLGPRTLVRIGALLVVILAGLTVIPPLRPFSDSLLIYVAGGYPWAWTDGGGGQLVVGEEVPLELRRFEYMSRIKRYGEDSLIVPWGQQPASWQSEPSTSVVRVDSDGLLTALAPGRATITGTIEGGEQATVKVRVQPAVLAFDRDSLSMEPGGVRALKVVVPSQDGREISTRLARRLTWTSSDSTVVVVRGGVVEALRPGRATIAMSEVGPPDSVLIVVQAEAVADRSRGEPAAPPDAGVATARDDRAEIQAALKAYGLAAKSEDLADMRQVYPGLGDIEIERWQQVFRAHRVLAYELRPRSIRISDGAATVDVLGVLVTETPTGTRARQVQSFIASLARQADRWVIRKLGAPSLRDSVIRGEAAESVSLLPVPPAAVDERPAIELTVRQFARAMGEGDLPGMLGVYPSMPEAARQNLASSFKAGFSYDVSRWRFAVPTTDGKTAGIVVTGRTIVRGGRGQALIEGETASFRLEKLADGWRITGIDQLGLLDTPLLSLDSLPHRDTLPPPPAGPVSDEARTDVGTAVNAQLAALVAAIKSRSLPALLKVYPDMPPAEQRSWRTFLENPSMRELQVTLEDVQTAAPRENFAETRFAMRFTITSRPSGVRTVVSRYRATFQEESGHWVMTRLQGLP